MNPNRLSDGTVIDSTLKVNTSKDLTRIAKQFQFTNGSLKIGNVIEILYPENENNITKKVIEYNVSVLERSPEGSSSYNTYNNCIVSNVFGSTNNYCNFTYQASNKDYSKGASVLILCVDGNSQGGSTVILGGLDATSTNKVPSAKDGQFYDFNFGGINININNDGEYSLTFNSKIDVKGKKANATAAGTNLKIDKDGKFRISDNEGQYLLFNRVDKISTWGNGADSISIDKKNKTISLTSSDKMNLSANTSINVKSAGTIDNQSEKDYNVVGGNNVGIKSKANMNMKADAGMNLDAGANFNAKAGAMAVVEGQAMAQIKGPITLVGAGAVGIGAVGISMSLGFDSHNSPVISTLLTGSFTCFVGT